MKKLRALRIAGCRLGLAILVCAGGTALAQDG
jgi:hypothetical protein